MKKSATAVFSIFAVLGVGLVTATPISAATPTPAIDENATQISLWWLEVKAYVGCRNGWFSYSAAVWDLQSNNWCTTEFSTYHNDGDL